MAIYHRWGGELTLREFAGMHKPKGYKSEVTLVLCVFTDDGKERYAFAEFLKADNGWQEIKEVLDHLPTIIPHGKALKEAIRQAE